MDVKVTLIPNGPGAFYLVAKGPFLGGSFRRERFVFTSWPLGDRFALQRAKDNDPESPFPGSRHRTYSRSRDARRAAYREIRRLAAHSVQGEW